MKKLLIVSSSIIFALLFSCSAMKETNAKRTEAIDKMAIEQDVQQEKMVFEHVIQKDSTIESHQLQVWPVGKFTYSATNGFEGNASKLLVNVNSNKRSTLKKQNTTTENLQAKTNLKSELKTTEKLKAKTSSNYGYYLVFFTAILVCFLAYWFVKRYFKFKVV